MITFTKNRKTKEVEGVPPERKQQSVEARAPPPPPRSPPSESPTLSAVPPVESVPKEDETLPVPSRASILPAPGHLPAAPSPASGLGPWAVPGLRQSPPQPFVLNPNSAEFTPTWNQGLPLPSPQSMMHVAPPPPFHHSQQQMDPYAAAAASMHQQMMAFGASFLAPPNTGPHFSTYPFPHAPQDPPPYFPLSNDHPGEEATPDDQDIFAMYETDPEVYDDIVGGGGDFFDRDEEDDLDEEEEEWLLEQMILDQERREQLAREKEGQS